MVKPNSVEILRSTAAPYVHVSYQSVDSECLTEIKNQLRGLLIIEIDGATVRDEKDAVHVFNKALGISVDQSPTKNTNLYWRRFEDLVQTDVDFKGRSGCVIFIKNAEQCLCGTTGGISYFADALNKAGQEYANSQIGDYYNSQAMSFHAAFLYNERPKFGINAAPIDLS